MKFKQLLLVLLLTALMPWGASAQAPHSYTSFSATSGTQGQPGEGIEKLLDNETHSKWCVTHFSDAFIEFCSAEPIIPVGYALTTANDTYMMPERNPKDWSVKAKLNPEDDWTLLASESDNFTLQATRYIDYAFPIHNLTDTYKYFRFEVSATQGANVMQLSEFKFYVIDEPASVMSPIDISCTKFSDTTATLTWARLGLAEAWQICLDGDENNLIDVKECSFMLTGLTPATKYMAKVRSVYGDQKSAWSDPVQFCTRHRPVEIPYGSDFETNCDWDFINGNCTNQWCWGEATHNGEGSHALYISNDGGVHSHYSNDFTFLYAIKPLFLEEDEYIFSYDWRCQGETHFGYLRVALIPDWENLDAAIDESFVPSGFFDDFLPHNWIALDGGKKLNESSDWQHVSSLVTVPAAGNYNLAVVWYNPGFPYRSDCVAIDNVKITYTGCVTPVNLYCTVVADTTATLAWTESGESTSWQICIDGKMDSLIDASTNLFALNGLSPETTYEAKVRAIFGDEQSEWSDAVSFTTNPQPSNKWLWFLIAIPIVIGLAYFWLKKRKNTKQE